MAPAAELAITKALATITIIWVPNSQSGAWFSPDEAPDQVQQAAADL